MSSQTRKKSLIWNYFEIIDRERRRATCKLCQKTLAYSPATMSNLNRHLKKAHLVTTATEQESTMEIFTVQEVEAMATSESSPLKTFEISLKNLDDLDEDLNNEAQDSQNDPDWTPETDDIANPGTSFALGPSEPKKEKKMCRRSAIWDHFQKSPCKTQGTCVHCGKVIKLGTISNLGRHLRQKHPTTAFVYSKPSTVVKKEIIQEEPFDKSASFPPLENYGNICSEFTEVNVDDIENPVSVIETKFNENRKTTDLLEFQYNYGGETNATQASQTEFLEDGEDFDINDFIRPKKRAVVAEQVDRELVKMIVKGCHPISIVEQPSFKDFVSLLNPKYVIPSTHKIAHELVPGYYQECEKKTTKSLKAAEGVCLYIDEWLSKAKTYLCVTAHIVNSECKFEALFLSCHIVSKIAEAPEVSDRLLETLKDWEVSNKVVAIVTDSKSIASTAVPPLGLPLIPHFLKTLSMVTYAGLQTIKAIISKTRTIIDEIIQVPDLLAEVYSLQKLLKQPQVRLITKVGNDVRSSFMIIEMLTRFEKLKTAIIQFQRNHPESQLKMTENEFRNLTSVVEVLSFFKDVKKEVIEEDRVSLSKVIFYFRALKKEMRRVQNSNNYTSEATYLATILEVTLNKEFEELEKVDFSSNVLLLDPRLKKHAFDNESEYAAACSKLKKEVCEVVLVEPNYPEPNPKSLWHSLDSEIKKINAVKDPIGKGILEFENYLHEQLLPRKDDPLVWWNQRSAIYPRLFKLAKKYLCVTSKAATTESISYKSAYMLSQLKHSDSIHTESEIMFLHHNM